MSKLKNILARSHGIALLATGLLWIAASAHADTFGSGTNQFTIDFTVIGNPGNAPDTNGYGAVGYSYRMGPYDISANQFHAATANGAQGLTSGYWSNSQAVGNVSWYQAAAFANWLDTSTGHQAAYNLTYTNGSYSVALWPINNPGYNPSDPYRNSQAKYFLPSENEWYKSAYYSWQTQTYSLYPTGNNVPTAVASGTNPNTAVYNQSFETGPSSVYAAGGLSSYGTMGQGGNLFQWLESPMYGSNTNTSTTNGVWSTAGLYYEQNFDAMSAINWAVNQAGFQTQPKLLSYYSSNLGFRVDSTYDAVPEPSSLLLLGLGATALLIAHRRRGKASSHSSFQS